MTCTSCPSSTSPLTSQLIHTPNASLPNRACAHAQPRSTLGQHRRRLAAALVRWLLERDARHLDVDVDTCTSAVGAGVRSSSEPKRSSQ